MKLNNFIANLLKVVEAHPELAELEVFTSNNGENIDLHEINNTPSLIRLIPGEHVVGIDRHPMLSEVNAIIIN